MLVTTDPNPITPRVARPVVAFVGNPNAGKTSLFNVLTGSNQKVGNYPGVTVERVSANVTVNGQEIECIDIPGLYSMNAVSEDEIVACDAIRGTGMDRKPDLLVAVLDVMGLERHLFFYSQLAELETKVIVVLTMSDVLERQGGKLDLEALTLALGVPVIPVVAHKNRGIEELRQGIALALSTEMTPNEATPRNLAPSERYEWASSVKQSVVTENKDRPVSTTQKIDRVLTHRVFGLTVFVGVMYLVFQAIYTLAGPLMTLIETAFEKLSGAVSPSLEKWPVLQSFVVDGLINGIGSVCYFLPQILILFALIAALEGSGYLARAAFLMDKLLGWCGLSGRAFVPLLSSFACAIPGVMAARVMPDPRSRLATILVAPLMSCSARLPVYVLLIGAVIEPQFGPAWAGFTLFAMHFLGLLVAIPVVYFINRKMLKGKRLPFVLELPRYQWPKWRDIWVTMLQRGKVFVMTAGTTIVVMTILIWATLYFPRSDEAMAKYATEYSATGSAFKEKVSEESYVAGRQTENSYLGEFGKTIEPAFRPLGFDWRLSTAILCAFPAREVVVPSMGIVFSLGQEQDESSSDLRNTLKSATWPDGRPLFTPHTAVGFMVFFALCCQCMSTLAAVRRETNSVKWPVFMFVYMTALAYLGAWIVNLMA